MQTRGLRDVPTEDLKRLLQLLHRGELKLPLDAWEIARHGLQNRTDVLFNTLRDLDDKGVRAVLVAVLSERQELPDPSATPAWQR